MESIVDSELKYFRLDPKIMERSLVLLVGVFCINFTRSDDQSPTFRPITVPLVRRLRLRLILPTHDTCISRNLGMPSLEEIWLEREVGQSIRDMTLYETLLARLNAPLKHITIEEHSFPMTWFLPRLQLTLRMIYQELDGVFRSAQHLTSLYLCPGVFMDPINIPCTPGALIVSLYR